MISPVRHPSMLRWKADAISSIGTGARPGLKGPELLGAVLRQPRADGVDSYAPLEAEGGSAHEAFDAAVCDGEAGRLRDRIVQDVAGHQRE
jgi:hypothetical protein